MRSLLKIAVAMIASACVLPAQSADFPSRPIRVVVPSTPGGALDVLVRLMSPKLTSAWNQQIVIDNRAGAAGIVGSEIVAKSAPDGHTLLVVATGYSANPFLYQKLPYETPQDFAPITVMAWAPNVLVIHPSVPAKNVKELIALVKSKPDQLNYASSGIGTGGHLSMALLARTAGIQLVHVPYKGAGAAVAAVVGNQSQILFTATGAAMSQIKSGRVKAIAVTSAKRVRALPEVPTVVESGLPGFVVDGWYAMLAPGKTPKPVIDRIYRDVSSTLKAPEVTAAIEADGFEVGGIPPAEFGRYIDSELKKWGTVIKEAGIKAE